jgi:hypothetical protein
MGVNDHAGDTATGTEDSRQESRALRRLLRSSLSPSSYGLVLVMIVVTYVLAATLSGRWAATILLSLRSPPSGRRCEFRWCGEASGSPPPCSSSCR